MKKSIILVCALIFVCIAANFSAACFAAPIDFPDVREHWGKEFIEALCEKGLILGMPDGNFHPDESVTIPQFVAIILRSKHGEIPPAGGDWASGYLDRALEDGIIEQEDAEKTEPMSRFDAAKIIYNSLRIVFEEPDVENTDGLAQTLSDYPSCHSCREPYDGEIAQCYAKGIIKGKPGNVFDGEGNLTRAEACVVVMKMIDPQLRTPAELPNEASEEPSGYAASTVTPEEARAMIAAGGITVLDVRDRVSYDSSRIANSICIPYGELIAGNTTSLPEKNTVIIVVCFYGATSEKACEYLSGIGYEYLFSLAGGMDSWTYETVGD